MKPLIQTKLHNPPHQNGNCMVAAIASVLECEIRDMPELENMIEDGSWWLTLCDWLAERGLAIIQVDFPSAAFFLKTFDIYCVIGGPANRGADHSVVYRGREMIHDPHPSCDGLLKEIDAWFFVPFDPAKDPKGNIS